MHGKLYQIVLVLGLLLLAVWVRQGFVGEEAVWLDEAYSLKYAGEENFSGVIDAVVENHDSHPPGYYLALHGWQEVFGSSADVARLFSVLFGVLSVVMIWFLGRRYLVPKDMKKEKHYSGKMAGMAVLMIVLLFFPVFYSLEIRMYSLMLFLMVGSLYIAFALIEKFQWWKVVAFVLVCAAMLYVHYFAIFWVGFLFLFWLSQGVKWWKWGLSGVAVLLLYLPWLSVLYEQVLMKFGAGGGGNFTAWLTLPEPSWKIFQFTFEDFFYFQGLFGKWGTIVFALAMVFFLGWLILSFVREKKIWDKKFAWFFGLGFFINLILPYLISVFGSSIMHPRYLQGAFLLSVILLAMMIAQEKAVRFLQIFALVISFMGFSLKGAHEVNFHPDWNGFFEKYGAALQGEIYVTPEYYSIPLQYNLDFVYRPQGLVKVRGFDYLEDDLGEVFEGEFVFLERLEVPEVVKYLEENCEIFWKDEFTRLNYYWGECR